MFSLVRIANVLIIDQHSLLSILTLFDQSKMNFTIVYFKKVANNVLKSLYLLFEKKIHSVLLGGF